MNLFKKAVAFALCMVTTLTLFSTTAYAADYTVVNNDSLYKIGQLFNTSVDTLKKDNSLKSDSIYPGQKLNVPAQNYTVKSGDTMYLIAKKYGITLTSLRMANNKWNDLLMPGQKLIIPGVKPTGGTGTVIPYTKAEVDLLARLINAEAATQPYSAMVAVGAVVVNRVQSPDWPNTISSVINQKIGGYVQFTPVKNGYINNPATDISIRAAWAALYGSDPSNGAMFYFDDSSTNQWLWSKPILARIDRMVFVQ
jgi:N-acetylmuramoyl-L-alanine amidase